MIDVCCSYVLYCFNAGCQRPARSVVGSAQYPLIGLVIALDGFIAAFEHHFRIAKTQI